MERDPQIEDYFASMKALSENPDFRVLVEDLSKRAETINSVVQTAASEGDNGLFYRRGQLNIIFYLMNLKENIVVAEDAYEEALELAQQESNTVDPYV